jgi:glycosyltransferase involved in cell wall biosynthesis
VVGKIGRLVPLKGHDDLFAVASQLVQESPRLKFLLVGDGPWRDRFERRAESLGLKRHFVFTGLVSPDSEAPLVGIMDLVVHLSSREGLARALPQALAAGRPVIAYDCDGAREVCLDGQTGFLIKRADLGALRQKIVQLAADPALRERLGNAGRQFVRERFSIERMVDDLYMLYHRLSGTDEAPGVKGYENRIST